MPAEQQAMQALQLLEAARAVLLRQALHSRSDLTELRVRHPDLAARFVELRDLLDRPSASPALAARPLENATLTGLPVQEPDNRRHLAEEFTRLRARIRELDGFASFALPPTSKQLLARAAHGPVAMFNVSRHRSDALLLTSEGVTAVPLPGLNQRTVIDQVRAFHQAFRATTDASADRIGAQAEMRTILAWLRDTAAEPVLSVLSHHYPPAPGQDWPVR